MPTDDMLTENTNETDTALPSNPTAAELYIIAKALHTLSEQRLPMQTAYDVVRNVRIVQNQLLPIEKLRARELEQNAARNADGTFRYALYNEQNQRVEECSETTPETPTLKRGYYYDDNVFMELQERLRQLEDMSIDVQFHRIPIDRIKDAYITPKDIIALGRILIMPDDDSAQ